MATFSVYKRETTVFQKVIPQPTISSNAVRAWLKYLLLYVKSNSNLVLSISLLTTGFVILKVLGLHPCNIRYFPKYATNFVILAVQQSFQFSFM